MDSEACGLGYYFKPFLRSILDTSTHTTVNATLGEHTPHRRVLPILALVSAY